VFPTCVSVRRSGAATISAAMAGGQRDERRYTGPGARGGFNQGSGGARPGTGPLCRMDLPGHITSVGTRTDYSVGPWDYPACATRHLKAWGTRTAEEKYSVRKLYMSCTVWKTPRRTRLVLSPYSDL
jgi:hypothetical protein